MKKLIFIIWILELAVTININSAEGQWVEIGPYGGYLASSDSYGNRIFVNSPVNGLFRSLDNGNNWKCISSSKAAPITVTETFVFAFINEAGMSRSTDDGETWLIANYGLPNPVSLNAVQSLNGILYAGLDGGGIYRSMDNEDNWVDVNNSLTRLLRVYRFTNQGSYLFAATENGIYRGNAIGENWIRVLNTGDFYHDILSTGSYIFAATLTGGVKISTDNGLTWDSRNNGLGGRAVNFLKYFGSNLFAATDLYVFKSTNNGDWWTISSNGLHFGNSYQLFTGNDKLFIGIGSWGIFQTTDSGSNWNETNKGFSSDPLISFTSNSQFLFAGTNYNGVYRSSNNGITWTLKNNGFLSTYYNFILTAKDNYVFCGVR